MSKKKKEEIHASEARYRKLFERAKDGILIIEPSTKKIIDANPYLLELIGYSLEEVIGKELWEIGAFENVKATKKIVEEVLEREAVKYDDLLLKNKSGDNIYVEFVSSLYPINESHSMIQCNLRNITDRIASSKVNEDLQKKFNQIANNIEEVFFISTSDLEVLYLNPAFEKVWGIPLSSMDKDPKAWTNSILPEDREAFFSLFEKNIKEGTNLAYEFRIKRPDDSIRWIHANTVFIKDEKGNIDRVVGVASDITREKLQDEKDKELDALKSKFIQIVSHQMRTPLTSIRWTLEGLLGGEMGSGKLASEHEGALRMIYNSNVDILERLDDLILSLDIESRAISLDKEKVDLRSLVDSLIIEYNSIINLNKLDVVFNVPDTKYFVEVDKNKMKHAISKVLDNAIRYTNKGGEIKIILEIKGGEVNLTIGDNGVGIPKFEQDRVFDKFFRASNASAMSPDASGLGLFIAKNIIELHNGKIWFDSKEGVGTDFYIKLPIAN